MLVANSDREPGVRYLFDRNTKKLNLPVQRLRQAAAFRARIGEADQLQVIGRPRHSRVSDAPGRCRAEKSSARRLPARRTVGPRQLGLQLDRAIPRQSWLRSTPTNFRASTGYGKNSSTPATTSGARRCRTTLPTAFAIWSPKGSPIRSASAIMGGFVTRVRHTGRSRFHS